MLVDLVYCGEGPQLYVHKRVGSAVCSSRAARGRQCDYRRYEALQTYLGRAASAQAHRAQNGHDFPASAGRCFRDALTAGAARIEPRHRGRDPALVQDNQVFRRDRRDAGDKLLALFTVGLGIALGGVERLFFSRNLSFPSSFQI